MATTWVQRRTAVRLYLGVETQNFASLRWRQFYAILFYIVKITQVPSFRPPSRASPHHLLLDGLNLVGVDADDGTDRTTVHFFHTHHDITATRLVEVVGKSTTFFRNMEWLGAEVFIRQLLI